MSNATKNRVADALKNAITQRISSRYVDSLAGRGIEDLLEITTKAQLQALKLDIEKGVKAGRYKWVPIGGDNNNWGRINQITKPESGISEGVTNSQDACIEKDIFLGKANGCNSPEEVAEKVGYSQQPVPSEELIQVIFQSFDDYKVGPSSRECATIDIRDFGIGIEDFVNSICNLGSNHKNGDKRFIGRFGQGGSTALSFVAKGGASLYMSSHINSPDIVSATMVRQYKDPNHQNPHFQFLVDARTGEVPRFKVDPNNSPFKCGTLVRHIGYKLDRRDLKYYARASRDKNSMFNTFNEVCVNPVIPFRFYDRSSQRSRDRDATTGNIVRGALARIEGAHKNRSTYKDADKNTIKQPEDDVVYMSPIQPVEIKDDDGHVIGTLECKWAVAGYLYISADKDGKTKPKHWIHNVVNRGSSGKFHLSGMEIEDFPTQAIRNKLRKLPHLDNYLLVYPCLDSLEDEALSSVMLPDRERLRPEYKKIMVKAICEAMASDTNLDYWNDERRKMVKRKKASEDIEQKVRDKLNLSGSGKKGRAPGRRGKGKGVRPKPTGLALQYPPTTIEIKTPGLREVQIGRGFGFAFVSDASPAYLDQYLEIEIDDFVDSKSLRISKEHGDVEGYNLVTGLKLPDTVQEGADVHVTVKLMARKPKGRIIDHDTVKFEAVPPKPKKPRSTGAISDIEIKWLSEEEAENNFMYNRDRALAKLEVNPDTKTVTVLLHPKAAPYEDALDDLAEFGKKGGRFPDYAQALKNVYEEYVALAAGRYYIDTETMPQEFSDTDESPNPFEHRIMGAATTACEFFFENRFDLVD